MGYDILRTEAFEDDYDRTVDYLVSKMGALSAAQELMREIDRAIETLKANPFIRAIATKEEYRGRPYREYLISRYLIVYVVEEETVIWLRFFHQRQSSRGHVLDWRW